MHGAVLAYAQGHDESIDVADCTCFPMKNPAGGETLIEVRYLALAAPPSHRS